MFLIFIEDVLYDLDRIRIATIFNNPTDRIVQKHDYYK